MWHAILVTVTVLASEYVCLKLETAEIKFSFGHIIDNQVVKKIMHGASGGEGEGKKGKKGSKK